MKYFFYLLFTFPLVANTIDPELKDFTIKEKESVHVDRYIFHGTYENLENIDIDACRKMRVEIDLSGNYPHLKQINYLSSFGTLNGKFTGIFPALERANFVASSTSMKFNLQGKWEKSCTLNLKGRSGEIELLLPKDVGILVNTQVGLKGRVINHCLQKQGRGILKKSYINPEQQDSPIQLTLNIEMTEGKIILN